MVHKLLCRLLAVLLVAALLAAPVSAEPLEQMAVEREVYTFLTEELGLSTAAACGVLANIEHESAFRPTIVGDQGTSYGLCQWHNERFSALRGYCSALGLDYRTVEGQMAYLKYELGNKYTTLLLTLQSIDNTPDGAYRAAYLWCIQFEKPSNMQTKAVARGELAQGKYWVRYSHYKPIVMVEPEPEPDPEVLLQQLKQNPVTIPCPRSRPERKRAMSTISGLKSRISSTICPVICQNPPRRKTGSCPGRSRRWPPSALRWPLLCFFPRKSVLQAFTDGASIW